MHLENVVWDAADPHALGTFWAAALGAEPLTDEPDLFEARVHLGPGRFYDLCLPRVTHPDRGPARLHLDLAGGTTAEGRDGVVERLVGLGASPADIGQGDVPWVVLADPAGEAFCVMEDRQAYHQTTGPVAAMPLDSADPARDLRFWAAVTGWVEVPGVTGLPALQHPDGLGPLLELCPEPAPKPAGSKNRLHLDVRREASDGLDDDAAVVAWMRDLGATPLSEPGALPWLVFADPSGNELCVLAEAQTG